MSGNISDNRPKVGLGVFIKKDNKFLFGQRLNVHGQGTWCVPGGHLEFGESWEECVERETAEEAGLKIKNIHFLTITNDVFKAENKHYVTIYMRSDWKHGKPEVLEPNKIVKWGWFSLDQLPSPLFLPMQNLDLPKIAHLL